MMSRTSTDDVRPLTASTAAFSAAALFSAMFFAWGAIGAGALPESSLRYLAYLAFPWHIVAFFLIAALAAPLWARVAGMVWALTDAGIDILVINGMEQPLWWPLRLGAHIGMGLWLAGASCVSTGARRLVGYLAAGTLVAYSLASPFVPDAAIMPSMILIIVWLFMTGVAAKRVESDRL